MSRGSDNPRIQGGADNCPQGQATTVVGLPTAVQGLHSRQPHSGTGRSAASKVRGHLGVARVATEPGGAEAGRESHQGSSPRTSTTTTGVARRRGGGATRPGPQTESVEHLAVGGPQQACSQKRAGFAK